MNALKEKAKKIGSALSRLGNWVGNRLGLILTIFSGLAAFLFLRERNKRIEAETSLALDEKQDAVDAAKQEVEHAQQEADSDYAAYIDAKSSYDISKRKPARKSAKTGSKKRATKRKRA